MRDYLIDDTGSPPCKLKEICCSPQIYILHHYSRFDVITLDGFTHRIIRTFAADLKLPPQFELVLDSNSFLDDLVDDLIKISERILNSLKYFLNFSDKA